MNALWIVLGVGLFAAVAKTVTWSQQRRRSPDLGFVSHQWLAEYRLLHS